MSFVGNNITGDVNAMYIYTRYELSGLSLLNNTLGSDNTDTCLYFYLNDTASLRNINVSGNNIFAVDTPIKFFNESAGSTNMIINYNRILAPIGLNFTDTTNDGSNFDYNWWGINDISGKIIDFTTNNHYIFNITILPV